MSSEFAGLPSITALRCFEQAATHLNFTLAARHLHLTQGAVSHQIRTLEEQLDCRLFDRKRRGLQLTVAGQAYLGHVANALEALRQGARALQREQRGHSLTISCSPNFAQKWLVPRLGSFYASCADLDLRISASLRHVNLARDDIDIAIRHGDGDWQGLSVTRLCREQVFPVCSPHLLADYRLPLSLDEIAPLPLLHDQQREGWETWLKQQQATLELFSLDVGAIFNQTSLAIDAAVAMQGVALARSALVELDLKSGRLIRPIVNQSSAEFAYWIVHEPAREHESPIKFFKNWLLEQTDSAI